MDNDDKSTLASGGGNLLAPDEDVATYLGEIGEAAPAAFMLRVLVAASESGVNDVLVSTADAVVAFKRKGKVRPATQQLTPDFVVRMIQSVMSSEQRIRLHNQGQLNFSFQHPKIGRRLRCAVCRVGGDTLPGGSDNLSLVIRLISSDVLSADEIGLNDELRRIALLPRGLFLMVGATGSGKSTTLASMIDLRNSMLEQHLLLIEDPIEYVHRPKRCFITQRDVVDAKGGWDVMVELAMRQAPDAILIGEITSKENFARALALSSTGHFVMATLHADSAPEAIDRICRWYGAEEQSRLRYDLSASLVAIASQRLANGVHNDRVPLTEIMLVEGVVQRAIRMEAQNRDSSGALTVSEAFVSAAENGRGQTFEDAVFEAWKSGRINAEEAARNTDYFGLVKNRYQAWMQSQGGGEIQTDHLSLS